MKIDDSLLNELVEIKPRTPTLTPEELAQYQAEAAQSDCGVVDLLVKKGLLTSNDVARAKAGHFGAEFIDLDKLELAPETTALIPPNLAREYKVIPVEKTEHAIRVAIADPSNLDTLDTLMFALDTQMTQMVVASEDAIQRALEKYYPLAAKSAG